MKYPPVGVDKGKDPGGNDGERGKVIDLFTRARIETPETPPAAPELPQRSPHEELLGTFQRYADQRIKRRQSLPNRVALRASLLDFMNRFAVAVSYAEQMGYTPDIDMKGKGNAAMRLRESHVDLRDLDDLRRIADQFHRSGRGVLLISSPVLTGLDPWADSPIQIALMKGIQQKGEGLWSMNFRISDDVHRLKNGRFAATTPQDATIEMEATHPKNGRWPAGTALQPKGILFLK